MEEFLNKKHSLSCTLDRFEGNFAVLTTQNNQTINWPRENLPSDAEEGSQVKLVLFSEKTEKTEREETVKAILKT